MLRLEIKYKHMIHANGYRLEVITGCMFSGKTEELIRRLERVRIAKIPFLLFKSTVDTRSGTGKTMTHYGREFSAHELATGKETLGELVSTVGQEALDNAQVIAFDEGNFFSNNLVDLCQQLVKTGKRVIVAGTDLTFDEKPFGPMGLLITLADQVDKLHAVCVKCGAEATRSQRIKDGKPVLRGDEILVGGEDDYEARCRKCYVT